jgi:hypothetical protein
MGKLKAEEPNPKYILRGPHDYLDGHEAVSEFLRALNRSLTSQLRVLLEQKHLYQRVEVEPAEIWKELKPHVVSNGEWVRSNVEGTLATMLFITANPRAAATNPDSRSKAIPPTLLLENVRLYCERCGERQAHAPIWFENVTDIILERYVATTAQGYDTKDTQILFLVYQCQLCLGIPKSFIVRRANWNFILEGYSPLEHIELPGHIPQAERPLFRDALVAWNTGKKLAGVFYLRAFIEQFARRVTGLTGKHTGDEIMETYAATLPAEIKGTFPSLREWYDKLSEPIHSADENAADGVFEEARAAVEHHFEIRRVFKVSEKPGQASQARGEGEHEKTA